MITSRALGLGLGFVSTLKWVTVKKLEEVEKFISVGIVTGGDEKIISVRIVTREAGLSRGKIAQIPQ